MYLPQFGASQMAQNPSASVGDIGLILGLVRSPAGGNGNPLQYSRLENPTDRGAWWAWGCKESDMTATKP